MQVCALGLTPELGIVASTLSATPPFLQHTYAITQRKAKSPEPKAHIYISALTLLSPSSMQPIVLCVPPCLQAALKQAFNVRLRPRDLANIAQCTLLEWTLAVQQQQAQQQQQAGPKAPAAAVATGPEVALSAQHVLRAVQQHMAAHSSSQGDQLAGLSVLQV